MFPLLNSFIHVLMYTYYGLAAAGAYKYLWWKPYLTLAQMLQFVILILHQSQVFIYPDACDYPKTFPAAICLYSAIFLVLFSNFYIQAYWKQRRQPKLLAGKASEVRLQNGASSSSLANGHVGPCLDYKNGHVANVAPAGREKLGRLKKSQ
ncbi:unnamed protein product [Protopolystoma xenopodis]|uniref:Elongation of very long chain fatty acids protein n=1 Tax=Protopolystoma xenopodis TaxID=117903 RepID=A0A448WNS5_9PLAT|nr:unnamed protein product [Protopolystoma xenopodis]